jgi:hypothetical protein
MAMFLPDTPGFLRDEASAFLPRVTVHDARAIETAMAGQDLWQTGVELRGAVVEAALARTEPPLLRRLAEAGVPYLVDPQTLRFANATFAEVSQIRSLPYAPAQAVTPAAKEAELKALVGGALSFQSDAGAAAYLTPSVRSTTKTWTRGLNSTGASFGLHRRSTAGAGPSENRCSPSSPRDDGFR